MPTFRSNSSPKSPQKTFQKGKPNFRSSPSLKPKSPNFAQSGFKNNFARAENNSENSSNSAFKPKTDLNRKTENFGNRNPTTFRAETSKRTGKFRKVYKNDRRNVENYFDENSENVQKTDSQNYKPSFGKFDKNTDRSPKNRFESKFGSSKSGQKTSENSEKLEENVWRRSNKFAKPEAWRTGKSIERRLGKSKFENQKPSFSREKLAQIEVKTKKIRNLHPKKNQIESEIEDNFENKTWQQKITDPGDYSHKIDKNKPKSENQSSSKNQNSPKISPEKPEFGYRAEAIRQLRIQKKMENQKNEDSENLQSQKLGEKPRFKIPKIENRQNIKLKNLEKATKFRQEKAQNKPNLTKIQQSDLRVENEKIIQNFEPDFDWKSENPENTNSPKANKNQEKNQTLSSQNKNPEISMKSYLTDGEKAEREKVEQILENQNISQKSTENSDTKHSNTENLNSDNLLKITKNQNFEIDLVKKNSIKNSSDQNKLESILVENSKKTSENKINDNSHNFVTILDGKVLESPLGSRESFEDNSKNLENLTENSTLEDLEKLVKNNENSTQSPKNPEKDYKNSTQNFGNNEEILENQREIQEKTQSETQNKDENLIKGLNFQKNKETTTKDYFKMPQVIILYGPPASGKGTQADFLKKILPDYFHLDFGTALRSFVAENLGNYFDPIVNAQIAKDIQNPALQQILDKANIQKIKKSEQKMGSFYGNAENEIKKLENQKLENQNEHNLETLTQKERAYRIWQSLANFEAVNFADLQFVIATKLSQIVKNNQKVILEGPGRSSLEAEWLSGLFADLKLEIAIFHLYISPSETVKRSATRFYVKGVEKPFISYQSAKENANGTEPYRRPEDEDSDGIMNRYNRLYADIFAQIISIYQLQSGAKVLTVDAHQSVDKVSQILQDYLQKWYNWLV